MREPLVGTPSRGSGGGVQGLGATLDAAREAGLLDASVRFAEQQLLLSLDPGSLAARIEQMRLALGLQRPDGFIDLALNGFARLEDGSLRVPPPQQQALLHSALSIEELDQLRHQSQKQQFSIERTAAIAVASLAAGAPLVYVLWLVRSGVLLGSYLSALPAWRLLDPLPILARGAEGEDKEEEEDDEALSLNLQGPADPLRGFG